MAEKIVRANMAARYWERKGYSPGRPRKFKTPADLWKAAVEYFQWSDAHPIRKNKLFSSQGEVISGDEEIDRPYGIKAFCLHANISYKCYNDNYQKNPKFENVCEAIDNIIYTQKFDGAAAGLYNANLLARDLHLADKADHTSSDGSMTPKESKTVIVTKGDVESVLDQI